MRALVLSGAFVRDLPCTAVQKLSVRVVTSTPLGRAVWGSYVPSLYAGRKPADFAERLGELKAALRAPTPDDPELEALAGEVTWTPASPTW